MVNLDKPMPIDEVARELKVTGRTLRNFVNGNDGRPVLQCLTENGKKMVTIRAAYEHLQLHSHCPELALPRGSTVSIGPQANSERLSFDLAKEMVSDLHTEVKTENEADSVYKVLEVCGRLNASYSYKMAAEIAMALSDGYFDQSKTLVDVTLEPSGLFAMTVRRPNGEIETSVCSESYFADLAKR